MKPNEIVSAEIVKMRITDINPALGILTENSLEVWRYNDFLLELQRRDSFTLVGKIETTVVGFCIARLIILDSNITNNIDSENSNIFTTIEKFKFECEIYNIAVKREFQKQGIGNKLLNRLVLLAKSYNSQSIWLEVRNSNDKAINFYQKNDFKQIYKRKNFYLNPVENAVVMKKDL